MYTDENVSIRPLLRLKLIIEEDSITLSPSLDQVAELLTSSCKKIAQVSVMISPLNYLYH